MKKKRNSIQAFKKRLSRIKKSTKISDDPVLSKLFDEKKLLVTTLLTKCSKNPECRKTVIEDLVKFQSLVNKQIKIISDEKSDPVLVTNLQKQIVSLLDSLIFSIKSKL